MKATYPGDIEESLVNDVLVAIHKYDGLLMLPTVLGCLDIIKAVLLEEHVEGDDD